MAHEIDFSKGFAAIATGLGTEMPWHGLVNDYILPEDDIDTIAKKSGLDWTVEMAPVTYTVEDEVRQFENRAVLYRSDTKEALSVMSESHYVPAQPRELIAGIMELVKGSGFVVDCVMALKGGKVINALARREAEPGQLGADIHHPYLSIKTSFDGTLARQANATFIREVCANTVAWSLSDSRTNTAKQRNSREFTIEKANDLFDKLGEFDKGFAEYLEVMRAMASVKMTDERLTRFFAKLYAPEVFKDESRWTNSKMLWDETKENGRPLVSTNKKNVIADLLNLVGDTPGSNLPNVERTLYDAFNTVTFYHDHKARTKGDKRWESASMGNGARMKESALELATGLVS